jgi:hypothetical protein
MEISGKFYSTANRIISKKNYSISRDFASYKYRVFLIFFKQKVGGSFSFKSTVYQIPPCLEQGSKSAFDFLIESKTEC